MPAQLVVLYKKPADAAAFDDYYAATHIPLAKQIPGLRRYEISTGPVNTPAGPSDIHLVALLHFDSMQAVQAAFASPEGGAAARDLSHFAQAGVDLLFFDSKDV
jgi:uncharacterized protein (TIGR02118 family)